MIYSGMYERVPVACIKPSMRLGAAGLAIEYHGIMLTSKTIVIRSKVVRHA